MTIKKEHELEGIKEISSIVAKILFEMKQHAKVGMSTKELDLYGQALFDQYKAISAPISQYKFPSCTCISINDVMAHGIASDYILKDGDLVNIDVSGSKNGYFADNGSSFVLGKDINNLQPLIDASKEVLQLGIDNISHNVPLNKVGKMVHTRIKKKGFKPIVNLAGHGVGKSLHEPPFNILAIEHPMIKERFKKNQVVAVEYFVSTGPTLSNTDPEDGWSLRGNKKGFVAQQEHTILITEDKPIILTKENGI